MDDLVERLNLIGCHANGDAECTCVTAKEAAAEIERLTDALDMARRRVDALADQMLAGLADGGLLGGRQLKRAVPGIFGMPTEEDRADG